MRRAVESRTINRATANAVLRLSRTKLLDLLLNPQNPILCGFGNTKFDDGLGWNLDLLLRLWIKTRPFPSS
jgi:hypothetical protein